MRSSAEMFRSLEVRGWADGGAADAVRRERSRCGRFGLDQADVDLGFGCCVSGHVDVVRNLGTDETQDDQRGPPTSGGEGHR